MVIAFCMAAVLCFAAEFPEYPVRSTGEYPVFASALGLKIGAVAIEDAKEQKTYFNTEFAPKGYVPIFVVLENQSANDSFLLRKDDIKYGSGSPDASSKAGKVVGYASLAALSLGGAIVAMKLISNASQVQQDILKKELQSKTLSAGTSTHGFLYVPMEKLPKGAVRQKIHLRIPVTHVGTNESVDLDLEL
jgi:hypothetical protein